MQILPPPMFDHPYNGHLIERRESLPAVENVCHMQHGIISQYKALGCAEVFPRRCFIVIPSVSGEITGTLQKQIRRHEIAHCNGWPENHPY
jgi:hypothetical protein